MLMFQKWTKVVREQIKMGKCKYCNGYNTNQPIFTKDFSKIMNIITKTQLNLKKKFCN